MVKVKLLDVANQNFQLALRKLSDAALPASSAWAIVKMNKVLKEHIGAYEEVRLKTLKKYALLKEDGNISSDETTGEVLFKSEEDKALAVKELDSLLEEEVEMPTVKIDLLSEAKIEARVLILLEKVIVD